MTSMSNDTLLLGACAFLSSLLAVFLFKRLTKSPIGMIPGPAPQSILLGNQAQYETVPVGERDHQWFEKFGKTFRFKGGWWEDVLYTSDPKAMQFILQTSAYSFEKHPLLLERAGRVLGLGLLAVEHDVHKRHRKVMLPAFALPQTKALAPVFQSAAQSLVAFWKDELSHTGGQSMALNVHPWLSRATLDAIGEASFGTKFGALNDNQNVLSKSFKNLTQNIRGAPSEFKIIMANTVFVLPPFLRKVFMLLRRKENKAMDSNLKTMHEVSRELLIKKQGELASGAEEKDLMTLLIKSNSTEDIRTKMSDDEVFGGMGAIMLAGHITTATTASYALWELAKHPEIQERMRSEIRIFYKEARDKGESCVSVGEYDKMEYTQAVLKETLRMHPLVPQQTRRAAKDITVPLSQPVKALDGTELSQIILRKGTRVLVSVKQYNRHRDIWGDDALTFNPERWLNHGSKEDAAIRYGVFENLATFGAGIHACIGWRFAVYELQAFLIELTNNFKFDPTPETDKVRVMPVGAAVPTVQGKGQEANMPLRICVAN